MTFIRNRALEELNYHSFFNPTLYFVPDMLFAVQSNKNTVPSQESSLAGERPGFRPIETLARVALRRLTKPCVHDQF